MPLADLLDYEAYTAQHMLPLARIELQLARIAMLINGVRIAGLPMNIDDYLIPAPPPRAVLAPTEATEAEADHIAAALGFKPINRPPKPTESNP